MIVADSDVLIDALRGRDPAASRVSLELQGGGLATSAITVFELRSGARDTREREIVDRLLGAMRILPLDASAAGEAAEIRRALEALGAPLPMADCLIAGICRVNMATLLTRNRKHFDRVPDLLLGHLTPGS